MNLALDEPTEHDEMYTEGGIQFVMAKGLMEKCGDVTIDFVEAGGQSGFSVSSAFPLLKDDA